jgi:type IV secretion system protein VirB10
MSIFRRRPEGEPPPGSDEPEDPAQTAIVDGERGIASVNRARSLQSRVSSVLALALMSLLGFSLLTWYYAKTASRQSRAQESAQAASKAKAQGEMPLPSLGPITPPALSGAPPRESDSGGELLDQVLGPPPEPPPPLPAWNAVGTSPPSYRAGYAPQKTPGQEAFERRLSGPVIVARAETPQAATGPAGAIPYIEESVPATGDAPPSAVAGRSGAGLEGSGLDASRAVREGRLSGYLRPSVTAAVQARVLPTERLLLAKGAFIDCTLETAIDSTLPGMTTCVTATDTFGVDGQVVLLERGTKLVGETQGQVRQGAARVFVLWTEARSPTGVIVPLTSPATDALGRSGLPGDVNRHFWERFGAAILISVIDGAVQAAVQSDGGGGTVIYNPSTTENIMTEVLKGTINIPPTIVVPHGDRIQVLVARDLDFRPVYALRPAAVVRESSNHSTSSEGSGSPEGSFARERSDHE